MLNLLLVAWLVRKEAKQLIHPLQLRHMLAVSQIEAIIEVVHLLVHLKDVEVDSSLVLLNAIPRILLGTHMSL